MQPSLGEWTAVASSVFSPIPGQDARGKEYFKKAGGKLGAGDTARQIDFLFALLEWLSADRPWVAQNPTVASSHVGGPSSRYYNLFCAGAEPLMTCQDATAPDGRWRKTIAYSQAHPIRKSGIWLRDTRQRRSRLQSEIPRVRDSDASFITPIARILKE